MEKIKQKPSVFEIDSIPRTVATLAIPSVLSMLVTVLYNMVDTVFVGQTHDSYQMNAVSMAAPVFTILLACGNLFGVGGCAFIARSMGAKANERVRKISSFSFWGALAVGAAATLLLTLGVDLILPLLGASADSNIASITLEKGTEAYHQQVENYQNLEQYTRDYLFYIRVGAIPTILSAAMSNLAKGEGAAKISMTGMIIGAVINIILDPIIILGLDMGVKGAAIATSLSNLIATLFYFGYLKFSKTSLSIYPKHFTVKGGILSGVLSIGFPMSLTNVLMSLSNMLINRLLNNIDGCSRHRRYGHRHESEYARGVPTAGHRHWNPAARRVSLRC
ncbi:MAG: polysaccharide biosynthesis C-terminal domain-containing protein [Ruminococcus sp.]|nr:polysaccharide biosynthesis C-terminal domain-containing protein [Ruminococcus sp.]